MTSGVKTDELVASTFKELQLAHKYKYVIYKMTPDFSKIVLDDTSTDTDYKSFVDRLPDDDGRYVVYDFNYTLPDGGKRNKLVFILWVPDTAKIKVKMLYASSKDAIKAVLVGIHAEMQATDKSDLEWDAVYERASRFG